MTVFPNNPTCRETREMPRRQPRKERTIPKEFENSHSETASDSLAWWKMSTTQVEAAKTIHRASIRAQKEFQRFFDAHCSRGCDPEHLSRIGMRKVEKIMMRHSATFLGALAIENLLKGFAIAHVPEFAAEGTKWDRLMTHDLVQLAIDSGLKPSEPKRRLLGDLSKVIVWSGRYPVPKRKEHAQWRFDKGAQAWIPPTLSRWVPFEEIETLYADLWIKIAKSLGSDLGVSYKKILGLRFMRSKAQVESFNGRSKSRLP